MAVTTKKKEIMAITIYQGVITAIDEFGNIVYYRQKGITNAPKEKIAKAIQMDLLVNNILDIPELPSHYKIVYECEEILGRPKERFTWPRNL
jgi:hypothetical protein